MPRLTNTTAKSLMLECINIVCLQPPYSRSSTREPENAPSPLHSRASTTKDRVEPALPQSANVRIVYGGNVSGPVEETMQKTTGNYVATKPQLSRPEIGWFGSSWDFPGAARAGVRKYGSVGRGKSPDGAGREPFDKDSALPY